MERADPPGSFATDGQAQGPLARRQAGGSWPVELSCFTRCRQAHRRPPAHASHPEPRNWPLCRRARGRLPPLGPACLLPRLKRACREQPAFGGYRPSSPCWPACDSPLASSLSFTHAEASLASHSTAYFLVSPHPAHLSPMHSHAPVSSLSPHLSQLSHARTHAMHTSKTSKWAS